MKKNLSILVCLCLLSGMGFAKHSPKKMKQKSIATQTKNVKAVERECCTKEYYGPNGTSVSITACAGWVFSNSVAAYGRACGKVDDAAAGLVEKVKEY